MIRSVHIPRGVSRMGALGIVQAGDGGSASAYQFDATGLSKDPQLAFYLQDLTPAQLQTALNGQSPNADLTQLLQDEQQGTGRGSLPCGGPNDPNCDGGSTAAGIFANVPAWAWVAGAGTLAALVLIRK